MFITVGLVLREAVRATEREMREVEGKAEKEVMKKARKDEREAVKEEVSKAEAGAVRVMKTRLALLALVGLFLE